MTPREIVQAIMDLASKIESLGEGDEIAQLNTEDASAIQRETEHLSAGVETLIGRAHVEPMDESWNAAATAKAPLWSRSASASTLTSED